MREHKQIDPTSLRPSESKQYFSLFIEDYNTATMPSEKYYDLHALAERQVLEYQELMAKKAGIVKDADNPQVQCPLRHISR